MNLTINRKTKFIDLGLKDYQEAWDYQVSLFDELLAIKAHNRIHSQDEKLTTNYLIFVEHPHVFTLGKSGDPKNLLIDEQGLKKIHARYYPINRGGDITYHGPGQLVGYPILDLENFFTDIHKYMRLLEEAVIQTLSHYGIQAGRIEGLTGVWVGEGEQARKICALGVKSSRWITMHGFALNINTDLSYFSNIVPCGISDKAVTSMANELGEKQNMDAVKEVLRENLTQVFNMEMEWANDPKV